MSCFPFNEIAALLIEDSATVEANDHRDPAKTADSIMATLSLRRLREYIQLHLIISASEAWTIDSERLCAALDLPADKAARLREAAELRSMGE
jgi:hypothetical protein